MKSTFHKLKRHISAVLYRLKGAPQAFWEELCLFPRSYILRRPIIWSFLLYAFLLILLKSQGWLDRPGRQNPSHWMDQRAVVTGIVIRPPDPRPKGAVYVLETETLRQWDPSPHTTSIKGKILLYVLQKGGDVASPGDRLRVLGKIQKPKESLIPGTFNYAAFLRNKGIYCVMYTGKKGVENLGPSANHRLLRLGWKIRLKVIEVFEAHLSEEQTAVLSGLLVGNRPRFHPEIRRIFIESGTMHILVASGSNVAFVVALWYVLMRLFFRLPYQTSLYSSLPVIWVYVLIVGLDPPIFRAGLMGTVALLSFFLRREDRLLHALVLAAFTLLLLEPKMLFDVGFQMSFITVFGMTYFLPKLDLRFNHLLPSTKWIFRLAAATLTAQVWLFPISTYYFKRFFPIGIIANMVVMPLAAVGLAAGAGLVFMDIVNSYLPWFGIVLKITGILVRGYVQILIELVAFFADIPGFSFWTRPPNGFWILGYYLGLLSVVGLKRFWSARLGFFLAILLVGGSWGVQKLKAGPPSSLSLTWLDVGRRLTLLVQTPEGKNILINPGPKDPYDTTERTLLPYLLEKSIGSLDAVFITTPNPKRVSGLIPLAKNWKIKKIYLCLAKDFPEWTAFKRENPGLPLHFLKPTETIQFGSLLVEILPGSKSFQTETPLLLTHQNFHGVFGHVLSLKTQEALLKKDLQNLDLLQARFSPNIRWNNQFLRRYKPKTLVGTGTGTGFRPSLTPWPDSHIIFPHQSGVKTIGWDSLENF